MSPAPIAMAIASAEMKIVRLSTGAASLGVLSLGPLPLSATAMAGAILGAIGSAPRSGAVEPRRSGRSFVSSGIVPEKILGMGGEPKRRLAYTSCPHESGWTHQPRICRRKQDHAQQPLHPRRPRRRRNRDRSVREGEQDDVR